MLSFCAITSGCQATLGSNTIYYVRDGTITVGGNVPQYRNDNFTNRYQLTEVSCYSGLASGQGSCFIKGYGGPGDDFGTLVTFSMSPTDCPLDSFISLLFVFAASVGVFKLKKMPLLN